MARVVEVRWTWQYEFTALATHGLDRHGDLTYALYMFIETLGGPKDVIYIGIVKSQYRDLFMRMNEHRKAWLNSVAKGQIFVKFGVIYTSEVADGQLLEDVESALVFGRQPRENTAKKQSYRLYEDVIVRNVNHEGFLKASYNTSKQRLTGS